MELEKLLISVLNKLHKLGFRSDESLINLLGFLVHERILAKKLENPLTIQIIEEFHHHTDNKTLFEIESVLSSVDFSSVTSEEFRDGCNFLIRKLYLNDKRIGEFFTPPNVTKLIVDFADPKPNQIVFDPTCGIGSFFVELNKRFPSYNLKFIGQEINVRSRFLCLINLVANEIFNAEIYLGNSLDNIHFEEQGKIDIAIANPPFNLRFPFNQRVSETVFIELMLSSIKKDGKIVVVVPESFLINSIITPFRKILVENDQIERIVSLPRNAFREVTGIKTSIIIINKNKTKKGFILFDSKEEDYEKTLIDNEKVLSKHNCELAVKYYAWKPAKEVEAILKNSTLPIFRINELISEKPTVGRNPLPLDEFSKSSGEYIPFVNITSLAKDENIFNLDVSKVERKISLEAAQRRTEIKFSVVLVSKINSKLKPTFFNFTGQSIIIGNDVLALRLEENVNVEYFITQLGSRLVQIQVEMMSSGTAISRISTEDLLDIQILLPSLEEQQRQILEMRGLIEDKVVAQEQLSLAKKEIETTEYDVIAAITHNLNQKLGQIVDDYGTLMLFLRNKEKNQMPIRFDEMLRPMRNGESVDNIPTFSKVANRLQNNLLDTAYTMKTTENILQKSVINIEELDIIKFFKKSIKPDFENPHFTLRIESKLKSLIVLADINALKDAFRNLIENAKKHGFTQTDQKYQIIFEISKYTNNLGENFARIVYKNNGNPFPKSYRFEDYTRLGTRMGKNKGTGIGGFFVKKVIDLHKGSFKEITLHENNQEIFQVQMEILLPLPD